MKFLRTLRDVLREIFEESAYERFCSREGFPPGRPSYSRFLRESERGERKVRCC
jgi:hypothetical protein